MRFWRTSKNNSSDQYEIDRLIDFKLMEQKFPDARLQIICDIDKTYLETAFGSVMELAKTALESAKSKQTVRGATETLLTLRWQHGLGALCDGQRSVIPLHFVSSSPPQMRKVLREKLVIDDLDWSSDTFKNQVYNIMKGRMDLLRHHVAYKMTAILGIMKRAGAHSEFIAIGDNAETDPYIYFGLAMRSFGYMDDQQFAKYLQIADIEKSLIDDLVQSSAVDLPKMTAIFIRTVDPTAILDMPTFGRIMRSFDEFYEVALYLAEYLQLNTNGLWDLLRRFHNQYGAHVKKMLEHLDAILAFSDKLSPIGHQRLDVLKDRMKMEFKTLPMPEDGHAGYELKELSELDYLQLGRAIYPKHKERRT